MTSMRKLSRRLARWQRYARRYRPGRWPRNHNVVRCDIRDPRGFVRAHDAWHAEQERRFWDETPEVWLGGPEGEAALIAEVLDEPPGCTLVPPPALSTCFYTSRPGCQMLEDDELPDLDDIEPLPDECSQCGFPGLCECP